MDGRALLEAWVRRLQREQQGVGSLVQACLNHGMTPPSAKQATEEALQEALCRAARIADPAARFENRYDYFWRWVRRVAFNYLATEGRRLRPVPLAGDWDAQAPPTDGQLDPEFLDGLTEGERTFCHLYFVEDYTLKEAAARLSMSIGRMWRVKHSIVERYRSWVEG